MTAVAAPPAAFLVLGLIQNPDGVVFPIATMSEIHRTEADAMASAAARWREALPAGVQFQVVSGHPMAWRKLQPGEIAECVQ